jgi:hypothetical protein
MRWIQGNGLKRSLTGGGRHEESKNDAEMGGLRDIRDLIKLNLLFFSMMVSMSIMSYSVFEFPKVF